MKNNAKMLALTLVILMELALRLSDARLIPYGSAGNPVTLPLRTLSELQYR